MEGNIAATYALIYRFLKQHSQGKAAEAVKKAAKPFVVLRDDIEQEGPPLEAIIKEWKSRKSTKSEDADSSSESSESSDDSSSSSEDSSSAGSSSEDTDTSGSESEDNDTSDSDESSDDSDEGIKAKELPTKSTAERDTSVTLSSAGENARKATKKVIQIPEKKSTQDESEGSESDSSDSDSSSKSSAASDSSDARTSSSSSDSSSSSESSDENEANENEKAPQNKVTTSEDKSSSSSESSSDSESEQEEDVHVTKKRKTSESGAAVTTAVATGSEQIARPSQRREKSPSKVKERFQRVKADNLAPELLLDNGYKARGGASSDYGERAHRDLIVTRGAGFRKEKNKKKRGSYRGGEITMENRSIRFDF